MPIAAIGSILGSMRIVRTPWLVVLVSLVGVLAAPQLIGAQQVDPAGDAASGSETTGADGAAPPVFVVPIQGEINPSLVVFLRRATERAVEQGASHIVFDIDTFGGRVDSALQITTIIGSLADIETIAFVPVRSEGTGVSWSAGALISFATDAIYMAPGTSMGSAAPVIQGPDGTAQQADEKTVSAVRTQMAALAEKNGYPVAIARAMVDYDVEVVEVIVDGEPVAVDASEQEAFVRDAEARGSSVEIGRTISEAGKLLSLTAGEMERYDVSSGVLSSIDAVLADLGAAGAEIVRLEPSSADQAVSVLTSGGVTSLLILVGLIALFVEITSPGFGVPGAVGILAFAVIFTANGLLGRVGSVELLLFLVGTILLVLEVFVIPGFGVAGISGIALVAVSLVLSMQSFVVPTFEWEWQAFHRNVLIVVGNILGALIAVGVLAHFVPRFRFFSRLVLAEAQETSAGYTVQDESQSASYLGVRGVTVTTLRPSGKAAFDEETIVVESEGEYIDSGTPVEIVSVNGNRVVVRRAD
jgi:membrane-bound serine protease (ClpP class)